MPSVVPRFPDGSTLWHIPPSSHHSKQRMVHGDCRPTQRCDAGHVGIFMGKVGVWLLARGRVESVHPEISGDLVVVPLHNTAHLASDVQCTISRKRNINIPN